MTRSGLKTTPTRIVACPLLLAGPRPAFAPAAVEVSGADQEPGDSPACVGGGKLWKPSSYRTATRETPGPAGRGHVQSGAGHRASEGGGRAGHRPLPPSAHSVSPCCMAANGRERSDRCPGAHASS
jgi:hypothetical protein